MSDLVTGNEPLVLADGTIINCNDGSISVDEDEIVEVPTHTEIQRDIVAKKRRLIDLPVPPQQMNTIIQNGIVIHTQSINFMSV